MPKDDEHIMEAVGKTRVKIKKGIVVEVGEPLIKECPLAEKFSQPVFSFNKVSVRANMEERIRKAGMFTKDRELLSEEDFVPFGASEMLTTGLISSLIDAAVIASDGAGTVVVTKPALVQGIGGRMSGLIRTSPLKEVIDGIEANGGHVLDPHKATIDQVRGAALAKSLGHSRIAVTVASAKDAMEIREADSEAMIIGVHLTGISKRDAELMVKNSDVVAGCASRWMREIAGRVALLQAGTAIPVFALTKKGKALIAEKVKETQLRLLVKVERLPVKGKREPKPLV
jgi:putative methanogenesis marker protein 8